MKKDIRLWYSSKHYQPKKLIQIGKSKGINPRKIKVAMTHCYNKIMAGKKVHDIDIAKYVFNVAKDNEDKFLHKSVFEIEELYLEIEELKSLFWFYLGSLGLISIFIMVV